MAAIKKQSEQTGDRKEMGRPDTLRYNVLQRVVEENYDRAVGELKAFMEKDYEYPQFKKKVQRYVSHAIDLVNAIRAKRRFPGIHSLTMSKQQEITDKFRAHYNELQTILKKIEKVHHEMKIEDVRSTIHVLKAVVNAVFGLLIFGFLLEGARGILSNLYVLINDYFLTVSDFLFKNFLN